MTSPTSLKNHSTEFLQYYANEQYLKLNRMFDEGNKIWSKKEMTIQRDFADSILAFITTSRK